MRAGTLLFLILIAGFVAGCSTPYQIILRNNAPYPLAIDFSKAKSILIAPGEVAELSFDYAFTQATIVSGNQKSVFSWRYPPNSMIDETKSPRRFALSFEADGKLYALKLLPAGAETRPAQPQPEGFPLEPTTEAVAKPN